MRRALYLFGTTAFALLGTTRGLHELFLRDVPRLRIEAGTIQGSLNTPTLTAAMGLLAGLVVFASVSTLLLRRRRLGLDALSLAPALGSLVVTLAYLWAVLDFFTSAFQGVG